MQTAPKAMTLAANYQRHRIGKPHRRNMLTTSRLAGVSTVYNTTDLNQFPALRVHQVWSQQRTYYRAISNQTGQMSWPVALSAAIATNPSTVDTS